jgi:hypothetical protein
MAQNIVVVLLVAGCFVYTLWTLAPKAPRSRLAAALLKLPLPLPLLLQGPLTAAVRQQGGCACDGCGRSAGAKVKPHQGLAGQQAQAECKPITFVRGEFFKKTQR